MSIRAVTHLGMQVWEHCFARVDVSLLQRQCFAQLCKSKEVWIWKKEVKVAVMEAGRNCAAQQDFIS